MCEQGVALGLTQARQDLTLAAILSSLDLDFFKLALVADSNLFRQEPNFDIQTALRSKLYRCL